jgi:hypothetical protein
VGKRELEQGLALKRRALRLLGLPRKEGTRILDGGEQGLIAAHADQLAVAAIIYTLHERLYLAAVSDALTRGATDERVRAPRAALATDGAAEDATLWQALHAISALPAAVETSVLVDPCRLEAVGGSASAVYRAGQ